MRMSWLVVVVLALGLGLAPAVLAKDGPAEKEPSAKAKSKRYEWKSKDGLLFHYRVPKSYNADKGAGLTLVLHGSNMDRRWGFANHSDKTFRPDDIVVSPDGTTSNGEGGFNFMGEKKDAKRVHALIEELKSIFKINGVYLYGHSQGSFFSLYYAGEYPDDVNGVVGHASGVWTWTRQGKKGHHQAIVLMHGTQDPAVPYGQSEGGHESYAKAKYPMVRLRSLEGWNHWPAEHNMNRYNQAVPHTSQQLAWVEGMTTQDPERLTWCFEFLAGSKFRERHDYAGTYTLAKHVETHEAAPDKLKARAAKVATTIEALVEKHIEALGKDMPAKLVLEKKAWPRHVLMFLRTFEGVPACEAFFEAHGKKLSKNREQGLKHLRAYYKARKGEDHADAFKAGLKAIETGFIFHETAGWEFRKQMKELRAKAGDLKIGKKTRKQFDAVFPAFEKAQELGQKSFDGLNKKHGKLP